MAMRYHIVRLFDGGLLYHDARDTVAQAPTIDEAHQWIVRRIQLARRSGLRLRPLDFDVVDTWE